MQTLLSVGIVLVLGAAAIWLGDPVVRLIFRLSARPKPSQAPEQQTAAEQAPASTAVDSAAEVAADRQDSVGKVDQTAQPAELTRGEALRGGRWIGYLERIAVFAGLIAGFPGVMALTLAIKGLGRYPELRSSTPQIAERFIIGTFVSLLWASAMAGLVIWLTALL